MRFLFDIETEPLEEEEIRRIYPPFDPDKVALGNRTKPETIEKYIEEQRQAYWPEVMKKAGLDWRTARALVVSYRFEDGSDLIQEGAEVELLGSFWSYIFGAIREGRAVGFNCHDFDIPFMVRRTWLCPTPLVIPKALFQDDKWINRAIVDVRKTLQCGVWDDKFMRGDLNYWGKLFGAEGKSEDSGEFFYQHYRKDRDRALKYCTTEMDCLEAVATKVGKWERKTESQRQKESRAFDL